MLVVDKGLLLNVDLVKLPTKLTFASEHDTTGSHYSASRREDRNRLVGCRRRVRLFNADSCHRAGYNVDAAFSMHNRTPLFHPSDNMRLVRLHFSDISRYQQLLQFQESNNNVELSSLVVSDRYIAVKKRDNNHVILHNFHTKDTTSIPVNGTVEGLHFLLNGDLVIAKGETDRSTLTRYRVRDNQLTTVWTCDGFSNGYAITSGSDGLIYLSSYSEGTIYIVSPDGKLNIHEYIWKLGLMWIA